MMAHASFLLAFIGMLLWTDSHAERIAGSVRKATQITLRAFVVPGIAIGVFYLVSLRGMTIGGGPPYSLLEVATQTLSLMVGGGLDAPIVWMASAAGAAVFGAAVSWLNARQDGRWLLYVASCLCTWLVCPCDPATRVDAALFSDSDGAGAPADLAVARISAGAPRRFARARHRPTRALRYRQHGTPCEIRGNRKGPVPGRASGPLGSRAARARDRTLGWPEARGAVSDTAGGQSLRQCARKRAHPASRSDGACRSRLHHLRGPRRRRGLSRSAREPVRPLRYYPSSELAGIDWTLYHRPETPSEPAPKAN